ncbi:MAG: PD40 domain-containing protein, partial [Acidobacteria bacterium]|nr:PD40 domain-containing protein [Acidobacteriota bacterium]
MSNKVLPVSADKGSSESRARVAFNASVSGIPDVPPSAAATTLSGKIGFNRRFRGLNRRDAVSLNLETKVETRLSSGSEEESNLFVRLSPDGTKVVFRSNNSLVIADADGKNPLTVPNVTYPEVPNWSPDSQHIVFASERLYMIDANGQNKRRISWNRPSTAIASVFSNPTWSPDGSKIFYAFGVPTGETYINAYDVAVLTLARNQDGTFITNPDGSIAITSDVQITSGLNPLWPALSPDGSKIAFYK